MQPLSVIEPSVTKEGNKSVTGSSSSVGMESPSYVNVVKQSICESVKEAVVKCMKEREVAERDKSLSCCTAFRNVDKTLPTLLSLQMLHRLVARYRHAKSIRISKFLTSTEMKKLREVRSQCKIMKNSDPVSALEQEYIL